MNVIHRFAVFSAASFLLASMTLPVSAAPMANGDIATGADLVAACRASVGNDVTPHGKISATACDQFLTGMVSAVYNSTEAGAPTKLYRLGKGGTESVCFHLPAMLKYSEFAALVVDYSKAHPELNALPAVELAGRSLADKYPCQQ